MREFHTNGHVVKVDDDIAALVDAVGVQILPCGARGTPTPVTRMRRLSHLVCPARPGFIVDHINQDPLDNRRGNLQVLSVAQNNTKKRTTPTPGVHTMKGGRRWTVWANGKKRTFADLTEAKLYADECRRASGIKGMPLNFPEVGEYHWDGKERTV
jgi:hypothetical protein